MSASHPQQLAFEAIGTQWEINVYDTLQPNELRRIDELVRGRIETFDRTYSRFRDDSLVTQAYRKPGRYVFPEDAELLFAFYQKLYQVTDGKVTPLIGDVLSDAGYDADYSLVPQSERRPAAKWDEVLSIEGSTVTLRRPAILDVGAAGKGYIVDIVGELLRREGINNFLVDAGGDILHRRQGGIAARIGLEHPNDPAQIVGVVHLKHESICASAGNRRAWAGLHHIMDPDIAQPVQGVAAVWVVAPTAILADGLATALFFTSPAQLKKHFAFEYFLIRSDLSYERSDSLDAEIFGVDYE